MINALLNTHTVLYFVNTLYHGASFNDLIIIFVYIFLLLLFYWLQKLKKKVRDAIKSVDDMVNNVIEGLREGNLSSTVNVIIIGLRGFCDLYVPYIPHSSNHPLFKIDFFLNKGATHLLEHMLMVKVSATPHHPIFSNIVLTFQDNLSLLRQHLILKNISQILHLR